MIENCLADTGMAQNTMLMIAALIAVFGIGLFLLSRRMKLRGSLLAILLVFVAAFFFATPSAYAQSTSECDGETASGLELVDDEYEGVLNEDFELSIVSNDLFEDGDEIDWDTLDLNPDTSAVNRLITLYHPDNSDYECGTVTYDPEVVEEAVTVYLSTECIGDSDELPQPEALTFQYTARSQSGKKAPNPATVTITLEGVFVTDHNIHIEFGSSNEGSINVTDGAFAVGGTIDPTSVDLDPDTPGQQTSMTFPTSFDPDADAEVTVDNDGLVTVTVTDTSQALCNQTDGVVSFPYTISSTDDVLSNEGIVSVTYIAYCV